MRLVEPNWLWTGLLALTLLALMMAWSMRWRKRALEQLVGRAHMAALTRSLSTFRRRLKQLTLLVAVGCLFAALARPQWGYREEQTRRQGTDLLFAVDTSRSMLAQDVRPSRMARAKLAIEDLLGQSAGDRLGLIAFAGDAFLQTPLTHDRTAFSEALAALEPGLIPVPGTDLESAIRVAEQAAASEPDHRKVLVLLTDGEDLSGTALAAAEHARASKLTIHTIGIGTPEGAELPLLDARGRTSLVRGPDGELVRSRLDDGLLRKIATATGGTYHELGRSGQGLTELYRDEFAKLAKQTTSLQATRVYHERFQWPLAAGLLLILLEWLTGERRRDAVRPRSAPALTGAALMLLGALLTSAFPASSALADASAPVTHYNSASAAYRGGKFQKAAEGYRRALDTPDLSLQERAYYDLGNSLYRQGQSTREKQPDQTIDQYKKALGAYDAALALTPKDADAVFNRDFVRKKLAELEQQQAQQKQKQNEGAGDQSKQKQKQNQQAGDQSKQKQQENAEAGQASPNQSKQPGAGTPQKAQAGDAPGSAKQADEKPNDGAKANAEAAAKAGQTPSAGSPQLSATQQRGQEAASGDQTGALTREQAGRLLDAVQGELRTLPSTHATARASDARDERFRKDW